MRRPFEAQLRQQMIQFGRLCYDRHLLVALDGNLSVRLSDDHILCTQAGSHKGLLTEEQLVIVDLAGNKIRGGGEPTSEMAMHLACYRERSDIEAVIHAHPPISIAFTVAGVSLARCALPEVVLTLGTIPTLPYETTGTVSLATRVGEAIRRYDAVLMDHHGAVCVGSSLLDAFCKLETMEHTATIMKAAQDLGGIIDLQPQESERLRRMGLKRYGGPPQALARLDQPGVDLPEVCTQTTTCEPDAPAPSTENKPANATKLQELIERVTRDVLP